VANDHGARILGKNILAAAGFVLLPILAALERHSPNIAAFTKASSRLPPDTKGNVVNEACQPCHAEIYRSYSRTPLARASGLAEQELIPGELPPFLRRALPRLQ
jgi:hypothetical protein